MPEDITSTGAAGAIERIIARRSIVIGLGGTGRSVCTELKRILLENHDNDPSRFPYIKILSIDSDKRVKSVQKEQAAELVRLEGDELFPMFIPPETHEYLSEFISPELKRILPQANEIGAGARRPIGHAFLVTNWAGIRSRIKMLHESLTTADLRLLIDTDRNFENIDLSSSKVDIYVVGNLVSGTGSGMAVGMGYLLRDLIAELGMDLEHHIEGVFTVCGSYNQGDIGFNPSSYAVNCYAALLELNHFFSPTTYDNRKKQYRPGYRNIQLKQASLSQPPYNYVQLLSPSHMASGAVRDPELDPLIASVLALRTGSAVGMMMNSKIIDAMAQQRLVNRQGRVRFCYSWGGISFRSSANDVLDLATAMVGDTVLDAIAGPYLPGRTDPKTKAQDISVRIGFGYGQPQPSSGSGRDLLMELMVIHQQMQIEGIQLAAGLNLTDALPNVIKALYPMPANDTGEVEGLPARLDRAEMRFSTLTSLINTVVDGNRERLTPLLHQKIEEELSRVADFTIDGSGSLDTAVKTIEYLVAEPGQSWLRKDSDAYRNKAAQYEGNISSHRDKYLLYKGDVVDLARIGRQFNYASLQPAWEKMVGAIEKTMNSMAQKAALSAARLILDGESQSTSTDVRVHSGLIKCLEELGKKCAEARDAIDRLEKLFENKTDRLRLRQTDPTQRAVILKKALEFKSEFLDADRLRSVARVIIERTLGVPLEAANRYKDVVHFQRDFGVIDQVIRSMLQNHFSLDIAQSIATNPTFDNRLNYFLDQSVPAIRLDRSADEIEELAFLYHPPNVQPFVDEVEKSGWYNRRNLSRRQPIANPRLGDTEPRVDVLMATQLFSVADVLAVRLWADSYARATLSPDQLRDVHTLPSSGSNQELFFEGLVRDERRLLAFYFIARCLLWLRIDNQGQVEFEAFGRRSSLVAVNRLVSLGGVLGSESFLNNAFSQPTQETDFPDPPLLQVETRFGKIMESESAEERQKVIESLAVGFAQLIRGSGEICGDQCLPNPTDPPAWDPFEGTMERIINAKRPSTFDEIGRRVRHYSSKPAVPRLGEIDIPTSGTPKPEGQKRGWYISYFPETGKHGERSYKEDDSPLPPGHYKYWIGEENDWSKPFEVSAASSPPPPPPDPPPPPRDGQ